MGQDLGEMNGKRLGQKIWKKRSTQGDDLASLKKKTTTELAN